LFICIAGSTVHGASVIASANVTLQGCTDLFLYDTIEYPNSCVQNGPSSWTKFSCSSTTNLTTSNCTDSLCSNCVVTQTQDASGVCVGGGGIGNTSASLVCGNITPPPGANFVQAIEYIGSTTCNSSQSTEILTSYFALNKCAGGCTQVGNVGACVAFRLYTQSINGTTAATSYTCSGNTITYTACAGFFSCVGNCIQGTVPAGQCINTGGISFMYNCYSASSSSTGSSATGNASTGNPSGSSSVSGTGSSTTVSTSTTKSDAIALHITHLLLVIAIIIATLY